MFWDRLSYQNKSVKCAVSYEKAKNNLTFVLFYFLTFAAKQSHSRVAFLCQNDVSYIISQWATWMSGQIGELKLFSRDDLESIKKY